MLRVFEAFAGYGSQRMALRNLGIEHEVVAISEFDKYADASYQAIHGETWNMDDITKIDVNDVPDHDLFTYSFPCQDISVAGKGKGFSKDSGTRSGLLWESERIIKAKKPKYLLMENVKNLISEKFMPGFVEWILALEELGYSNYYEVLNAKDFGIPQNRERVFMVSILGEHEPYVFPKPIKLEKRLKDVLEDEVDERYYLDNEKAEQLIATITEENNITNPTVVDATVNEPKTKEVMNTITARYDSGIQNYKSIGGAVVEPEIKQVGQYNTPTRENSSRYRVYGTDGLSPTLTAGMGEGGNTQPFVPEPSFVVGSTQKNASITDGSYSPTLTSSMGTGGGHVPMIDEPKAIEGIPIINNTKKGYLLATEGDGVDLAYAKQGKRRDRVQKDMAQTLTADDSKGVVEVVRKLAEKSRPNDDIEISVSENGDIRPHRMDVKKSGIQELNINHENNPSHTVTTNHMPKVYGPNTEYRIRKLTPLECFRLMDVTDEDFYKAQAVNSNSQLYKQAGNSIVVSVLEAIFRNMFLEVPEEDLVGEHIPLF